MMNRLHRLSQFKNAVSVAAGVIIAQKTTAWLEQSIHNSNWLSPIIALIVVAICFQVSRFVFEMVIESSKTLRKFLLGRQYVEGIWLDIMSRDGSPILSGVSRIEYSDTSLCIDGEDFDIVGHQQGHYVADMVTIDWPVVKYKYSYQHSNNPGLASHGYGELQFIRREGCPKKYTGCYFDLLDGKRITYEGWKIEDKQILKQLDKPELRKETIIKFFESVLHYKKAQE